MVDETKQAITLFMAAFQMSHAGRILHLDKLVELYKVPGKTE